MSWCPVTGEQLVNTKASLLLRASPLGDKRWRQEKIVMPAPTEANAPYCEACMHLPPHEWCRAGTHA